jgi:hypothetical protein
MGKKSRRERPSGKGTDEKKGEQQQQQLKKQQDQQLMRQMQQPTPALTAVPAVKSSAQREAEAVAESEAKYGPMPVSIISRC